MFKHEKILHVYYQPGPKRTLMGRLAIKERKIFFEYEPTFIKYGLNLSPLKLPIRLGAIACEDRVFDGLFGVFNDSLPDGWGRLLLDRKLFSMGIAPLDLTPLDRLAYVGSHGMGALIYEPEIRGHYIKRFDDLDIIADECLQFLENGDDRFVDDLFAMNGSSAGARPKILVSLVKEGFELNDNMAMGERNDWIIKFCSSIDPSDSGPIEYGYHLMAEGCGLDVPEAKLFNSRKGYGYFGVKRFDRVLSKSIHMLTVSGMLHIDHRLPSLDYETLMKLVLWLTKDAKQGEKLFRQAVFNVMAHNRDDHAKNFSFLMDETGSWRLSPAYDLIYSAGPMGEHCTMVMGAGKNPNRADLLKLAEVGQIKEAKAMMVIKEVAEGISRWMDFAKEAHVTPASSQMISRALEKIRRNGEFEG